MVCRFCIAAAAAGAAAIAAADVVFDSSNAFGGIRAGKSCTASVRDGTLRVADIQRDPQLAFPSMAIDPCDIDTLEYRYRANGTGNAPGQLYWWTAGGNASDYRRWKLPAPVADGKWHTVTLGLDAVANRASWLNGGVITGLRLDPTDAAGGTVEYEYVRLKGHTAKAAADAPKWQGKLDAPEWPEVEPKYYDHASDPAFTVKGAYFKGGFISAAADAAGRKGGGKFQLRRRFTLKGAPSDAWLQGMGDSRATFSVNGRIAMRSRYIHNIAENMTARENVLPFLKAGENVIMVEYETDRMFEYAIPRSFPGGVIAELFVSYPDGSHERIDTDGSFESSVDGKAWTGVVVSPPPPEPPRDTRLQYCDFAHPQTYLGGGPEAGSVKAGETVMLRHSFEGDAPEGAFPVRVTLAKGASLWWEEEIEVGVSNIVRLAGGRWRLDVPFAAPLYIHAGDYGISLESNSIYCRRGGRMAGKISIVGADVVPGFERPVSAEVKEYAGWPALHIDGRPFPVLWGASSYGKRIDRQPRHSDMPLTVVTAYLPDYREWHPQLGVYDFAAFDRTAEKYRRTNPSAYFIWDLQLYPPADFALRFPDDMSADDKGDRSPVARFSWSYASRRGMDEIKEMAEKAIRWLEASPYANRIIGYRINSGHTIEWLNWGAKPGRTRDFSPVSKAAFARFAAERYPSLKDPHIPTLAERRALDAPNDILWDRERHLNAIAYTEFASWQIAQDVLEACGHAKKVLGSLGRTKVVGTYYGYTHYLNINGRDAWRGHFSLQDILDRNGGTIDFLISPQSYSQRRLGDTCADMKPFATMAASGILPVVEDDSRTHNRIFPRFYAFKQTMTPAQTEAAIRRNASISLCRRTATYFLGLASGYDFGSPECAEVGRDILSVQRLCTENGAGRHADVALVASERSVCASPDLGDIPFAETGRWVQEYAPDGTVTRRPERAALMNEEIFGHIHTKFARAGVPVDLLLAEDLKSHIGDYRLYVFLNQFTHDDATLAAVKRLRERGAAILWLYAPGRMGGSALNGMEALTGMKFAQMPGPTVPGVTMKSDGRYMGMPDAKVAQAFYPVNPDVTLGTYADGHPGLAATRVGKSLSFFSGTWQLDVPFIMSLVKRSGAHVYCDSDDPIEANDALFTLHARSPGVKNVRLPRKVAAVVDVFGKRVVARDADKFSFSATLHSTHLFYFGPDAESLCAPGAHGRASCAR